MVILSCWLTLVIDCKEHILVIDAIEFWVESILACSSRIIISGWKIELEFGSSFMILGCLWMCFIFIVW